MFGSSGAPVTLVKALWSLFHLLKDAIQLLLEKGPSLRPWHNRPYALEALWKLEGLRAEWHMELSAAGTN